MKKIILIIGLITLLFSCQKEKISIENINIFSNEYVYTKGTIYIKGVYEGYYIININNIPFKVGNLYYVSNKALLINDTLHCISNQEHIYITKN
jgi:hypothetical protein